MVCVDYAIWPWKGKKWCHMFCDDLDELHGFAERLGLKRSWFQDKKDFPHYDLTVNKRRIALEMGALAVDKRIVVAFVHKNRRLSREEKK